MDVEAGAEKGSAGVDSGKDLNKLQREELTARLRSVDSCLIREKGFAGVGNSQGLVESLRKQIEFYFGDPNLKKDIHLRNLIAKHKKGYVDLKVLLTFNKISQLLANARINKMEDRMNNLRQAVTSSQLLKLCKQKLKVKRLIPFSLESQGQTQTVADVDSRTVYMENLPPHVTLELLASVFSKYGQIILVNLPRTEKTAGHKIKGFAFIEFSVRVGLT